MPRKSNWNTPDFRRFEVSNFNISIPADYTGKDILDVKAGSQRFAKKISFNKRPKRRVG